MTDDQSEPPKKPLKLSDLAKLPEDIAPPGEIGMEPQLNATHILAKQLREQQEKIGGLLRPSKEAEAFQKHLESLSKPSPAVKSILDQVENQRRLLDSITNFHVGKAAANRPGFGIADRFVPVHRLPDIKLPKNPVLDTNAKLANIEQKFEGMLDVLSNAARIGNEIQAQAATFIEKFEVASDQTDKSAKKAIRVGVIALVIATLSPFAPMVVDYFAPNRTVPTIEALTREVVSASQSASVDNQKLIEALKGRDEQIAERLMDEVRRKQDETNVILSKLLEALKERDSSTNP
ncbi:hypothetical protein [Mesorhizobium sp.]|uniref:hypothetical protein n=1 Tax=Mesorhizobium sp. TaxID=1871066 RepID=UPI0025E78B58|nr:hypothetical protein [Mesorhizobium sp.]